MKLTDIIKQILRQNDEARHNSAILFAEVCKRLGLRWPEDAALAPKPETVGRLALRVKNIYGWRE